MFGPWGSTGDPAYPPFNALARMPNGDVLLGSELPLSFDGTTTGLVSRWNGVGWASVGGNWSGGGWNGWSNGTSGHCRVAALAVRPNGRIVAGGAFTAAGGTPALNIAEWNGSTWTALGAGLTAPVKALAILSNGDVIANGSTDLKRWNGVTWSSFGGLSGSAPVIHDLLVLTNGDLLMAGDFTAVGGVPAVDIARWDGSVWSAVGNGISVPGVARCLLEAPGGDIVVGGAFASASGIPANNIARWNGAAWGALGTGLSSASIPAEVLALEVDYTGAIVAGGKFDFASGPVPNNLARWTGASWQTVGAGSLVMPPVVAIVSTPSYLVYAGGGASSGYVGRLGCPGAFASASPYGVGCGSLSGPDGFYEQFAASSGVFDLSQSTVRMTFNPPGHAVSVVPGAPNWFPALSAPLALGDDDSTAAIPLTFILPQSGVSVTDITIGSNGRVGLGVNNVWAPAFYGNVQGFLGMANHSPLYGDWDPIGGAGAGTIHLDIVPGQAAYVTWQGVQVYGAPGVTSTFQLALFANGDVEYRYQNCALGGLGALTGYASGSGLNPGVLDLSAAGVFTVSASMPSLAHTTTTPRLGTVANLRTYQVPASSPMGGTLLSLTPYNPGVSLDSLGMPGCILTNAADVISLFLPSNAQGVYGLSIPNDQALVGLHVYSQGFAFLPWFNAFGAITSNGIDMIIGY